MAQNARYQGALAIKVDPYNDTASLKNILEFGQGLKALFVEVKEEDWVIRAADGIVTACLEKLVNMPGLTTDDLIFYYHKVTTSAVRMAVLTSRRASIKNISSTQELLDLARFFKFAVSDTAGMEAYVINSARGGVNDIDQKLLTTTQLTPTDAKTYFHEISDDQTVSDVIVALTQNVAAAGTTDLTLLYTMQLLEAAAVEAASRAPYVLVRAQTALYDIYLKLVVSNGTSTEDKMALFHKIVPADQRRQALDGLNKTVAQLTTKGALSELRRFFDFAADDSAKFEAWLPAMARASSDAVSQRLLTSFDLTDDEAQASFHELRSDQIYSDIIVALQKRVDDAPDTDPSLPRLTRLLELAISQSAGHADWVTARGTGALDDVASKIAVAKDSSIETRKAYFHKIRGSDQRRKVLEALTRSVDGITTRDGLMVFMGFFNFAADDSASFESWLPQMARAGVDKIAAVLFANYQLGVAEAKTVFHQIVADQGRRDILIALRTRVPLAKDKAALSELDQIFTFALEDSASRPSWVGESASAAMDDISIRAITQFDLTDDEARLYFRQIGSDQTSSTILTTLVKKMERNRETYPILLQIRKYFEIASQESGRRAPWVASSAATALENASARIIKKPVVDADEMIRLFKTLQADQTRADVVAYWRGKIVHAYDDKASLLALARFFNAALENDLAKGTGDWVLDAARFGVQEITSKILALFPVFEGIYDIESTCEERNCATGFLDTMVIMNTLSNDGLQISFMHAATGTPAFAFNGVNASRGGQAFDAMLDAFGGLSRMHLDYDVTTGQVVGYIDNSDRLGHITLRGQQRRSPVDIYDAQAARIAAGGMSFPQQLPNLSVRGTFDGMPATLSVRSLTSNEQTVIIGVLSMGSGRGFRVNFQRGTYNPKTGMLVLSSSQQSDARMKIILGTEFSADGRATLRGTSFSSANNRFHELSFKED